MAVEYSKIGDNVGIDRISELLGGDAELLLNHVSKTIPKESLHLPGPDTSQLHEHFLAAGYGETSITAALLRAGTNVAEAERLLAAGGEAGDTSVLLVKRALGGSSYDRLLLVDDLAKQKDSTREFVDMLATVAMVSLEATAHRGMEPVRRWQMVLQAAHTAQGALERSGNAKLVLTELMLAL